jgi:hypothetical protein
VRCSVALLRTSILSGLEALAASFARHDLDAVLIGSAALALHGDDVKPRDLDFLVVDSARQRQRLAAVAADVGCAVTRPFYRLSIRFHFSGPIEADFLCAIDGFNDLSGLRSRATRVDVGAASVVVAAREDVVRSKEARAAGLARSGGARGRRR